MEYTYIAIVIGCTPEEEHTYTLRLNSDWLVLFIDMKPSRKNVVRTYKYLHIRMGFNEVDMWKYLFSKYKKVDLVIVDYSVAQLMSYKFNFTNGVIFNIIEKHMEKGAKFYSYCCHSLSSIKYGVFGNSLYNVQDYEPVGTNYIAFQQPSFYAFLNSNNLMTEEEYLKQLKHLYTDQLEIKIFSSNNYPLYPSADYDVRIDQKFIIFEK